MHTIVIGERNKLRNSAILDLEARGFKLEFSPPVYVDKGAAEASQAKDLNLSTLGRTLIEGEVGCWLAHDKIRQHLARLKCHEWHVILEDDAGISEHATAGAIEKSLTGLSVGDEAAVVSLYSPGGGTDASVLKITRSLAPTSGTVAYAINLKYCELDNPYGLAMTADWPLFAQSLEFRRFHPPIAFEIQARSEIGASSRSYSPTRFYLTICLRFARSVRLGVPISLATRAVILNPLLRDVSSRLSSKGWRVN